MSSLFLSFLLFNPKINKVANNVTNIVVPSDQWSLITDLSDLEPDF